MLYHIIRDFESEKDERDIYLISFSILKYMVTVQSIKLKFANSLHRMNELVSNNKKMWK